MASQIVKVAISLPKKEFIAQEKARKALGKSRSAVITQALNLWLKKLEEEKEIQRYIEGYKKQPETDEEVEEITNISKEVLMAQEWKE